MKKTNRRMFIERGAAAAAALADAATPARAAQQAPAPADKPVKGEEGALSQRPQAREDTALQQHRSYPRAHDDRCAWGIPGNSLVEIDVIATL